MPSNVTAFKKIIQTLGETHTYSSYNNFVNIDNDKAIGFAKNFKIFNGLHVSVFDLKVHNEISLENIYPNLEVLHFLFCSEGSLTQINVNEDEQHIARKQNVILSSFGNKEVRLKISANTRLKFSFFTLDIKGLNHDGVTTLEFPTKHMIVSLVNAINTSKEFSFFGGFSTEIATLVSKLIKVDINRMHNRLNAEALVYSILAKQYEEYLLQNENQTKKCALTYHEKETILELGDYLSNNLAQKHTLTSLVKRTGLNEKKIQYGFTYFYGETINKYITNLRLIKAQELLDTSNKTISEIVYEIGLNSRSYFSTIFYRKLGVHPKEYSQLNKINNPTYELCYASSVKGILSNAELNSIVKKSRKKNKKNSVTGCLVYHEHHFYQILEGTKEDVLKVMKSIKKDNRHYNVKIILEGYKSGRIFKKWKMGFISGYNVLSQDNRPKSVSINLNILKVESFSSHLTVKRVWERIHNYLLYSEKEKEMQKEEVA